MFNTLLAMADSDLIHGQRLAELCSKGPELEIDIALSNIGLDFLGQARMLYQRAAAYAPQPTDEDKLAYLRTEREYRNNLLVEQPNKDFAYTIVKQYLLDNFRKHFLQNLMNAKDQDLAGIAGKAVKENTYHLKFSTDWLLRLGDGTAVSHDKTQAALDYLWPYCFDLFVMSGHDRNVTESGNFPDLSDIEKNWLDDVTAGLKTASLTIPDNYMKYTGGKDGNHTEYLGYILAELQYLQRSYPGLNW